MRSTADPEATEAELAGLASAWLDGPDWPDVIYRIRTPGTP